MKVYIASDHAGFSLKEILIPFIESIGHFVSDLGPTIYDENDDYPALVRPVGELVSRESDALGIIIGGSGEGEAMVVNHIEGIRCAEYYGGSLDIPKLAREHNNANILSIGARFITENEAKEAVQIFLETPFSGEERHKRRVEEIE